LRKGIRIAAPLALLVALGPGLLAVPRAGAAGPSLTVSPATELAAGQYVKVTWSNMAEGKPIYLRQCPVNPSNVKFCDQLRTPGYADADGSGSIVFPVLSPYTNVTAKGEPTKNSAKCDSKHACAMALFLDKNATDVKGAVYAKLQLEPDQAACPAGGLPSEGTGAGGPFRAFLRWEGKICRATDPVDLNYVLKTSVGGLQDFAHALATFGTTTIPFSAAGVAPPAGAEYKFAPLTESGLVFGYRMFDHQPFGNLGDQITNLRLTPDLLAKIFTGQIANWNDPQILALNPQYDPSQNPGHGLPPLIRAFGRGDACDESYLLTSWFENVAKATYEAGGDPKTLPYKHAGITTTMPSTGETKLVTGSTALGQEVAFASSDNDPYQYGFIGYMDSSTAAQYSLQTVQIQNAAGKWVTATPSSIAAAVSDMTQTDGVLQPDFGTQDPDAYPMPVVSYAIARQNVPDGVTWDGDTGKGLQTFLDWAAADGQKDLPDGYAPLSSDLAAQTTDAASGIPGGTDGNPPPPTTPPPTTSAPGGPGGPTNPSPSTSASDGSPSSDTASSPTDGPTLVALPPGAAGPGASLVAATTRLFLPMLLVLMIGALLAGPAMTWFGKHRAKTDTAGAGSGETSAPDGSPRPMRSRLRMPRRKGGG
jgi:phosphate transport system substrate-binding protein